MNNYETILSLVSQADAPLEDVLKKQSELGQEADTIAQTVGGALIHGSTKNIIEHLQERIGKVRDDIVQGVKNKLAEVKDTVMDRITDVRDRAMDTVADVRDRAMDTVADVRDEAQARLNEVVSNLTPEGADEEINPVLSYLRNLQTPHNFDPSEASNINLNQYTDEDVERGIRQISPELSDDDVQTGVRILNDNQAFTEQFPNSDDDPATLETQRVLQRQKLGKIGREAMENEDVERAIDGSDTLRDNKELILRGLQDDNAFNDLHRLRAPNADPLDPAEIPALRKRAYEQLRKRGERIRQRETEEPAEAPAEAPQEPAEAPAPPPADDEAPLSAEELLPEGSGRVGQDVDLRQLTGQRRATNEPQATAEEQTTRVSSRLDDPVPQNTTATLQATDELQGGQMASSRALLQNQRDIQQQINNLRVVPEGERPADLPFLEQQTLTELPEAPPTITPTMTRPTPTTTEPTPIEGPVDDDITQATRTALSNVQSETQDVLRGVSSSIEGKISSVGSKLAELTEESTIGDDTGVGDVLTLGLGLASLFTGGLFHHAPKVVQPVVSQLLNPTFQMGVNE